MQHSACTYCSANVNFLSPEPCPKGLEVNFVDYMYNIQGDIQQRYESPVQKVEETKQRLVEVWQNSNTAADYKDVMCMFLCFARYVQKY